MMRNGLAPPLAQHLGEPYLKIYLADARQLGLAAAKLVEVTSPHGRAVLRVLLSEHVAPGHQFAPMHWTGETAPTGRIDALVAGVTNPVSGQPASKSTPVAIRPFEAAWYAYVMSRQDLSPACEYWAKAPVAGGMQVELAGTEAPVDWADRAAALFGATPAATLSDPARGLYRFAFIRDDALQGAVFVARDPVLVVRGHVATLLGKAARGVLAGRAEADQPDPGPTVCACLNVGLNTISARSGTARPPAFRYLAQP